MRRLFYYAGICGIIIRMKRFLENLWEFVLDKLYLLRCMFEALGIFGAFFVLLLPLVFIIIYAKAIGPLWIVLLILYLSMFIGMEYYLIRRKIMLEHRAVMGDEVFFKEYPREYKKELKRKRREERIKKKKEERRG